MNFAKRLTALRSTPSLLPAVALLVLASSTAACTIGQIDLSDSHAVPEGPVAYDASQAWPNAPAVPAMDAESVARACAAWSACTVPEADAKSRPVAAALCASGVIWSAERAIPMSDIILGEVDERAELFVKCAIDHSDDCAAVSACLTPRKAPIYCEEDGCRAERPLTVTCAGSVATLADGASVYTRDCARAFAACDPASPTGCTDRHFSACPSDEDRSDHCDGDVRLGCDGSNQVSYHDCERLGGTCGALASGGEGCDYGPADPECGSQSTGELCKNGELAVCVGTRLVTIAAPAVCPAAP